LISVDASVRLWVKSVSFLLSFSNFIFTFDITFPSSFLCVHCRLCFSELLSAVRQSAALRFKFLFHSSHYSDNFWISFYCSFSFPSFLCCKSHLVHYEVWIPFYLICITCFTFPASAIFLL
jgi:hypothetical protein